MDVAAELFATQGFAATSMEQVAAVCGVGKDTLYRRYPSKAALFAALMAKLQAKLIPALDRAIAIDAEPLERLRHYARTLLAINLRPDLLALNRVALGGAMTFGGVKPIPTGEDPVMKRFTSLVEKAQGVGVFVGGDAGFLSEQLLYATSIKPIITTMLGDDRFRDARVQDAYFDRAWTQFLDGAAPRRDVE